MKFSDWLINQIRLSNKTRKEIAKIANIPKARLDDFCKDVLPDNYMAKKLARALNVDEYIFHDKMCSIGISSNLIPIDKFVSLKSLKTKAVKKPGEKVKRVKRTKRSKVREIEPPEEKHCRNCNVETGTETFRHAESRLIKFIVGGATYSGKLPDRLSGWLCDDCDRPLSQPIDKDSSEIELLRHAFEWSKVIFLTWNVDV